MSSSTGTRVSARVRLAADEDVHHIHRMIHQMAEFERLTHLFSATEAHLSSTLFPKTPDAAPPFHSFSVFILDLHPQIDSPPSNPNPHFHPILRQIDLGGPVEDDQDENSFFEKGDGWVTAGFVLFFPNYSTFLAKPGFYVEDLFVRRAFRRKGLGRMLLSAVAKQAADMGLGRVEWCVLDWNSNAISFYKDMGADVMQEWRICRLSGDALRAYGQDDEKN